MKRSPRPRKTAELPKSLQQQLNMYALAAGAAGVSVVGLIPPSEYVLPTGAALVGAFVLSGVAEAKIVYTPAHTRITSTFSLDLNHDGKIDFRFNETLMTTGATEQSIVTLFANPARNGNGIAGAGTAYALPAGVWVGPKRTFSSSKQKMAWDIFPREQTSGICYGNWSNVKHRYLGLRFSINGKTHFGWARMNVTCRHITITGLLTGYAYETIPQKGILTGKTKGPDVITVQPGSLGHLAAGTAAIPAWRSRK